MSTCKTKSSYCSTKLIRKRQALKKLLANFRLTNFHQTGHQLTLRTHANGRTTAQQCMRPNRTPKHLHGASTLPHAPLGVLLILPRYGTEVVWFHTEELYMHVIFMKVNGERLWRTFSTSPG